MGLCASEKLASQVCLLHTLFLPAARGRGCCVNLQLNDIEFKSFGQNAVFPVAQLSRGLFTPSRGSNELSLLLNFWGNIVSLCNPEALNLCNRKPGVFALPSWWEETR